MKNLSVSAAGRDAGSPDLAPSDYAGSRRVDGATAVRSAADNRSTAGPCSAGRRAIAAGSAAHRSTTSAGGRSHAAARAHVGVQHRPDRRR